MVRKGISGKSSCHRLRHFLPHQVALGDRPGEELWGRYLPWLISYCRRGPAFYAKRILEVTATVEELGGKRVTARELQDLHRVRHSGSKQSDL